MIAHRRLDPGQQSLGVGGDADIDDESLELVVAVVVVGDVLSGGEMFQLVM